MSPTMNDSVSPLKAGCISGSLRTGSLNRKALRLAGKIAAEMGCETVEIDLKKLSLPIYDGDLEAAGMPDAVKELRAMVDGLDLLIIASPEYNHSISGALKNAIDWLSVGKNILDGKTAAIFGVSTGLFGTMRGQAHLRQVLNALNVTVLPQPQLFIRSGNDAFTADGSLSDGKSFSQMQKLISKTIGMATLIKNKR